MPEFSRRRFLGVSLGCAATALGGMHYSSTADKPLQRFTRTSQALGTCVSITLLARDDRWAGQAAEAAFAEIDAIEDALSLYRHGSDLRRLNRDGVLNNPDPRLVEVLRYAVQVSQASRGAFDVTVQPLWELYASARRAGKLPGEADIAAARDRVDWRGVEIAERQIRFHDRRTQVTLNGIAQGYAADRAGAVLRKYGIEHALIDAGELAARGRNDASAWRVGVQHPDQADAYVAVAQLENRALATSGDYSTTFSDDRRHHHLLDPATGCSPGQLASVSIAAPTAMEADALSTACFVLGVDDALTLLQTRAGCDALFVTKEQRMIATPGFPQVQAEVVHG